MVLMRMNATSYHPLPDFLQLAVPIAIADIKRRGGVTDVEIDIARNFVDDLASRGDILLYRSDKKGETAKIFADFARVVAIASFFPGGIHIFGCHYQVLNPTT